MFFVVVVDLVKRDVLALVGEIQHYGNARYYYYCCCCCCCYH